MIITFRSQSTLSHQGAPDVIRGWGNVYITVNSLNHSRGVIYTLEVGQTVFVIKAMLMLFILHSATINSACGTPSPRKDHSAQVWKCNMRACLSSFPKWRVHCLVSVIPSPSGSQLLDLHCHGILPQAHWTGCSLKSILIYPHIVYSGDLLPPCLHPLLSSSLAPDVSHLHTSWPMKTCSFASCLYKCPHPVI